MGTALSNAAGCAVTVATEDPGDNFVPVSLPSEFLNDAPIPAPRG